MKSFFPSALSRRVFLAGAGLLAAAPDFAPALAPALAQSVSPVTAEGRKLAAALDRFEVEKHWIAGVHVNWETGDPDGRPVSAQGRHTHCSAFVAAAAKRFGVYILRPPEHGQILLANAQSDWLKSTGAAHGWSRAANAQAAQDLANSGRLVVAAYRSRHDSKPGHIAIVRPGDPSAAVIAAQGPQVAQAGTVNSSSISLREGFAGHPAAWKNREAEFFAHDLN